LITKGEITSMPRGATSMGTLGGIYSPITLMQSIKTSGEMVST